MAFSPQDRAAINLRRAYSLNQIEYCRNCIFRRHFPIHKIFERSCELGAFGLAANKIAQIFGVRKHKRMRGKLHSLLEKLDHGHHVLRVYCKSLVARMYEKFSTFLHLEIDVNRMKDLGLNKGLENLPALRQKLVAATDRLASFEAEMLNVQVDFPPLPTPRSPQLHGWRTAQIHEAILSAFGLSREAFPYPTPL